MIDLSEITLHTALPVCFLGGLLVGYAYFRALHITANLLLTKGHPLVAIGLTLGRMALLVVSLYIAVLIGGLALLAALAGVLCAKALLLRRYGGIAP